MDLEWVRHDEKWVSYRVFAKQYPLGRGMVFKTVTGRLVTVMGVDKRKKTVDVLIEAIQRKLPAVGLVTHKA